MATSELSNHCKGPFVNYVKESTLLQCFELTSQSQLIKDLLDSLNYVNKFLPIFDQICTLSKGTFIHSSFGKETCTYQKSMLSLGYLLFGVVVKSGVCQRLKLSRISTCDLKATLPQSKRVPLHENLGLPHAGWLVHWSQGYITDSIQGQYVISSLKVY